MARCHSLPWRPTSTATWARHRPSRPPWVIEPQDRPHGGGLVTHHTDREQDQVIVARLNVPQRQALDDGDVLAEQNEMSLWLGRTEALDGEVVDADELHTGIGQQLRRIGREVGEVLVKGGVSHPAVTAVAGAKEDTPRAAPLVLVEL